MRNSNTLEYATRPTAETVWVREPDGSLTNQFHRPRTSLPLLCIAVLFGVLSCVLPALMAYERLIVSKYTRERPGGWSALLLLCCLLIIVIYLLHRAYRTAAAGDAPVRLRLTNETLEIDDPTRRPRVFRLADRPCVRLLAASTKLFAFNAHLLIVGPRWNLRRCVRTTVLLSKRVTPGDVLGPIEQWAGAEV